jgi:ABC-type multidrug transport system fused ATPase/permease subunit
MARWNENMSKNDESTTSKKFSRKSSSNSKASRESPSHSTQPFNQLQFLGLHYLKHQITMIIIPVLFSVYTLVIQAINILFLTDILRGLDPSHLPPPPPPPGQPPLIDQLTPTLVIIIFAIFVIIKGRFLIKLRRYIVHYELQQKSLKNDNSFDENPFNESQEDTNSTDVRSSSKFTLATIFYKVIDHMELLQKISICLYIVFIFYSQWYIRYFLSLFGLIPGPLQNWDDIIFLLNFLNQLALFLYIIFDLRQFLKWHSKLKRLKKLEQTVSEEFEEIHG